MAQAVRLELNFDFSDVTRGTVFFKPGVLRYSPGLDEALRAVVRDETASRAERYEALDVLRSWRIELDPHLYPFARTPLRELKRRRDRRAKGAHA